MEQPDLVHASGVRVLQGAIEEDAKRMATSVPTNPKIYHIVHVDRLESIVDELLSMVVMLQSTLGIVVAPGTTIGMNNYQASDV